MTVKSKLLKQISDQYPNFFRRDIERIFNIFIEEIKGAVKRGHRVELRGFGSYSTRIQKERISRNPRSGVKLLTPKKKTIYFKMNQKLFNKINNIKNNEK